MQVLFKSRHPQFAELRDLTERRVRFVLRRMRRRGSAQRDQTTAEARRAVAGSPG